MKAIVRVDYGPPERLQLLDVAQPVPTGDQVLVRVHAASVNALDWRPFTLPTVLLRLTDGFKAAGRRTILGADLAGRVEAVGPLVQRFRPGRRGVRCGSWFVRPACVRCAGPVGVHAGQLVVRGGRRRAGRGADGTPGAS